MAGWRWVCPFQGESMRAGEMTGDECTAFAATARGRAPVSGGAILVAVAMALAGCAGGEVPSLSTAAIDAAGETVERKPLPDVGRPSAAVSAGPRLAQVSADIVKAITTARALRQKGDRAGALASLDQAARKAPKDAALARERGLLALELGRLGEASMHLEQAVAGGATDWQTYSGLGAALAASGKPAEARRHFSEALRLAPGHPAVMNNMAMALALEGKRKDALRTLEEAAGRSAGKPGDSSHGARLAQNRALLIKVADLPTGRPRKRAAAEN